MLGNFLHFISFLTNLINSIIHLSTFVRSSFYCIHKQPRLRGQGRSQNAEKVTHIKGELLDQAVILFISSLFKMGTSLKGKNLLPEEANSFLQEQFLMVFDLILYVPSTIFQL